MIHATGTSTVLPIILIDDDTDDLEIMIQELAAIACTKEVFAFDLPAEALEFLRSVTQQPYMISCDVHMPRMDAYDFRLAMLEELPHLSYIPFYVLSSVITEREVSLGDTLQINGFYTKGFTREAIQQNFRDMIG